MPAHSRREAVEAIFILSVSQGWSISQSKTCYFDFPFVNCSMVSFATLGSQPYFPNGSALFSYSAAGSPEQSGLDAFK